MASSSHQRSNSSGPSKKRRLTHVGTGTSSRTHSAEPPVAAKTAARTTAGSTRASGRGSRPDVAPSRRRTRRAPTRTPSAKQLERDRLRVERRRTLVIRAALVVAVIIGLFGGWSALAHSSLFTIETVTVEGARELSVEEVIEVADIGAAETLLGIDEDAVVARLEAVAWIAGADVVRKFPSTILLRVEERERFLMIDAGDTFWALDRYGRVLGESMPDTATPVPLVRDVPAFTPTAGEIVGAPEVENAIEVLAGITPELRVLVRSMSSPGPEETALMTTDNVEIMIGRAEQLREKSVLALEIMAEQGSSVVFIDVRSLERPVSRGLGD